MSLPKQLFAFFSFLSIFLFLGLYSTASMGVVKIRAPKADDAQADYVLGLVELALAETQSEYSLEKIDGDFFVSVSRLIEGAVEGSVDIVWTATNKSVEERLIPVRIPLYMGLFGYRVLIVHKENQNLFSNVETLQSLKAFKFGQGRGWSDTAILAANEMKVVQATKWDGLFHMTDGGRFHAFPRAVHEPWGELNIFKDLQLAVDEHVLLVYRMPFYLFVNPKKPELAQLLEHGLNLAIKDGSFVRYFKQSETLRLVSENAQLATRQIIRLDNPDLPAKTPIDRKELWLESLVEFESQVSSVGISVNRR